MTGLLWVMVALVVFLVGMIVLALRAQRRSKRAKVQVGEMPWWFGLDYQVRRAIECGDSDEMLIRYAENVAFREWNSTHSSEEQVGPNQLPYRTVSIPHVTATTPDPPRVRFNRYPKCSDCEFETLTMFGGEAAIPVRTVVCPTHQEDDQ